MRAAQDIEVANPTTFTMRDRTRQGIFVHGELDEHGVLRAGVHAQLDNGTRGTLSGRYMFDRMMDHFGRNNVRAIQAEWLRTARGLSSNLDLFEQAVRSGRSFEQAAWRTKTGEWA